MDRKFCGSCQSAKPADGFKLVKAGSRLRPVMRWKCSTCLKKSSESIYSKKEKK